MLWYVLRCAALIQVVAVVTELQKRELFRNVPLYAVGASSGGAFALTITAYLGFSGMGPSVNSVFPTHFCAQRGGGGGSAAGWCVCSLSSRHANSFQVRTKANRAPQVHFCQSRCQLPIIVSSLP